MPIKQQMLVLENRCVNGEEIKSSMQAGGVQVTALESDSLDRSRDLLELLQQRPFGLLLINNNEQFGEVLTLCADLREAGVSVAIIIVYPGVEALERKMALESGADECLDRAMNTHEIVAYCSRFLSRCGSTPFDKEKATVYCFGHFTLDTGARILRHQNVVVELTSGEYQVLVVLVKNAGVTLTRAKLVAMARGHASAASARSVDIVISRLRRSIEHCPSKPAMIKTVFGVGYVFVANVCLRDVEVVQALQHY